MSAVSSPSGGAVVFISHILSEVLESATASW